MLKIYLTGPESTGKTTLAKTLSEHYSCPWVPEYARQFLQEREGKYQFEDIEQISRCQLNLENQLGSSAPSMIFTDTDQLVLYIWSLHKFGNLSIPIEHRLKDQKGGLHLLCSPDLPWEPDPLRESPNERPQLFEEYKAALDAFKLNYAIIDGLGKERLENAVLKIETFLKE